MIELPRPTTDEGPSLARALARRRSVRSFEEQTLTHAELAQLLWAAQGVTSSSGQRAAPSAGATYPMEVYVAVADGLFRYVPNRHALVPVFDGDVRGELERASHGQDAVAGAPVVMVIAAEPERTAQRYGSRATRYVHMEAGHVAQNVLLQATALGLGAVPIGAFDDRSVARAARLRPGHEPLYLIPIGHPADD